MGNKTNINFDQMMVLDEKLRVSTWVQHECLNQILRRDESSNTTYFNLMVLLEENQGTKVINSSLGNHKNVVMDQSGKLTDNTIHINATGNNRRTKQLA